MSASVRACSDAKETRACLETQASVYNLACGWCEPLLPSGFVRSDGSAGKCLDGAVDGPTSDTCDGVWHYGNKCAMNMDSTSCFLANRQPFARFGPAKLPSNAKCGWCGIGGSKSQGSCAPVAKDGKSAANGCNRDQSNDGSGEIREPSWLLSQDDDQRAACILRYAPRKVGQLAKGGTTQDYCVERDDCASCTRRPSGDANICMTYTNESLRDCGAGNFHFAEGLPPLLTDSADSTSGFDATLIAIIASSVIFVISIAFGIRWCLSRSSKPEIGQPMLIEDDDSSEVVGHVQLGVTRSVSKANSVAKESASAKKKTRSRRGSRKKKIG